MTRLWGLPDLGLKKLGLNDLGLDELPEPADVVRLARRLLNKVVQAARAEDESVARLLAGHLGPGAASCAVVSGSWRAYDHVNLQAGLDAWLAGEGRQHTLTGLTGLRHSNAGLAELMLPADVRSYGIGVGSVAMTSLPSGPAGQTRACVQYGLYLVTDGDTRLAMLLRGPDDPGQNARVTVEVACADQDAARRVIDEVRRLAVEKNVFRGQVIAFGGEVFGGGRDHELRFLDRPALGRDSVVLPAAVIDGIEQHVLGVARHAGRLLASGQHLKRGVLLHGAPGTGKTHTVRYLLGRLEGVTVVVLSGYALGWIAEACSVARALQPSVVVVEDVDLIAEERGRRGGQNPLLFELLNEMDGLAEDADVTFLLTTNRPDVLEGALAARPGRVDHAVELPFPDAEARRRLIELYRGSLDLELSDPETVVSRTDGVTAAFLKELMRRAALLAAEANGGGSSGELRVTDAHMDAALGQLLDVQAWLTRELLGGRGRSGQDAVIRPMGADLLIRRARSR